MRLLSPPHPLATLTRAPETPDDGGRSRWRSGVSWDRRAADRARTNAPHEATALYAGLRLGELRALRVADVDLATGVIRVERGWDPAEGPIKVKSHAGRRKVPITAVLRDYLAEHLVNTRRQGPELVFGLTPTKPFTPNRVQGRPMMRGPRLGSRD